MTTKAPRPPRPITPRQQSIADWIGGFIDVHGYSPTLRQMAFAFNAKTVSAIQPHLNALRRKGVVTWVEGQARTIRIVKEAA